MANVAIICSHCSENIAYHADPDAGYMEEGILLDLCAECKVRLPEVRSKADMECYLSGLKLVNELLQSL